MSLWPSARLICTKDFTSLLVQLNGLLSLPTAPSCLPIPLGAPSNELSAAPVLRSLMQSRLVERPSCVYVRMHAPLYLLCMSI